MKLKVIALQVQIFTNVSMFHNKNKLRLLDLDKLKILFLAMLTLFSVLFLLGKGFHSITMLFFVFYYFLGF